MTDKKEVMYSKKVSNNTDSINKLNVTYITKKNNRKIPGVLNSNNVDKTNINHISEYKKPNIIYMSEQKK